MVTSDMDLTIVNVYKSNQGVTVQEFDVLIKLDYIGDWHVGENLLSNYFPILIKRNMAFAKDTRVFATEFPNISLYVRIILTEVVKKSIPTKGRKRTNTNGCWSGELSEFHRLCRRARIIWKRKRTRYNHTTAMC